MAGFTGCSGGVSQDFLITKSHAQRERGPRKIGDFANDVRPAVPSFP